MSKELVISAAPHETRVAILEDNHLCEIYIEREKEFALVGSIYKGRVTRVLPGMQSAFVDIGLDSDAFLYVSDFLENVDEYEHIASTVEGKVEKMEQQGGHVFAPARSAPSAPSIAAEASSPPALQQAASAEAASKPASDAGPPSEVPRSGEAPGGSPPRESLASPPPSTPPYEQRDRNSRGFGRDRGRRGRWGRRRDRRHGRELPPSKYASPQPYEQRPQEPRPYQPAPGDLEPILLPGESLAKYKNRPLPTSAESAAAPPPVQGSAERTAAAGSEAESRDTSRGEEPERSYRPLPESLYVGEPWKAPGESANRAADQYDNTAAPAHPDTLDSESTATHPEISAERTGWEAAPEAPMVAPESGPARADSELTDEQVNLLAEQLTEAKQEEAQAEAAALPLIGEEEEEDAGEDEISGENPESDTAFTGSDLEDSALRAAEAAHEPASGAVSSEPGQRSFSARIEDRSRPRFQRPMRRGGRHRGGHALRRPDRHAVPRRPQLISEMLKANQEIIVQIAKEPLGKKGARITSHVALPGRFLVYMPTVDHIGVSRKIASSEHRGRLRRLVAESKGSFPGGFIVRTAAESASDDEIRSDVEFLGRTWSEIRGRAEQRKAPSLLHRDLNLVERILRDYLSEDYVSIWIDNEDEFSKVVEFVGRFQPKLVGRVKLYTKEAPIFEEFGIQQELDKALRPKVWLKSGGYIVINHTEALVAIDVNTGKYVGRGSTRLEDTIVKTNLEAVKEIVRQIRLRDLGGIIVVDFIDMEVRRNREKVMAALDEALQSDRAPSKVLSFNEFGLVAITRKRTKQALERVLCQACPYCTGSGMVKSVPTICYEIQAEARKMSSEVDAQSLTLRVHPEIAKALKTREAALIEELEQATRKSVIIQSDPTLHWEQYDIY